MVSSRGPMKYYSRSWSKTKDMPWAGCASSALLFSIVLNVLFFVALRHHGIFDLDEILGSNSGSGIYDLDTSTNWEDSLHNHLLVPEPEDDFVFSGGRRTSSSSSSSSSTTTNQTTHTSHAASSHGSAHGSHAHQHYALLYLFNALVVGAAVMQLSAKYPWMQQTVVLFVLGFVFSLFMKAAKFSDELGEFGVSYDMWMAIDPHLLLFTLLPALLAGDAMTIDTSIAKKVGMQCMFLAGPGVLIGGFGCAFFLWGYLGWDFWLCLCAGAILCATDPVAVVALLKELGASPILTVQIQGESLLNDGTAIVLYLISYDILKGEHYEWTDVAEFMVKKAMMAFALGLFIGFFFFSWIRSAADKLDHSSGMIQITLTLCCAYWSFIFVEGYLQLSGVLATVASSLVLAHHMWPYVVSEESMLHVWHTFESLGNIVIFFLAGSITGKTVIDIRFIDYIHLLVIYIFLLILRGCMMFGSRPILKYLHADGNPVTVEDAAVMTWGGLRGAVGLALAMQVMLDRAPKICGTPGEKGIKKDEAERLLFYVSGVAFLTMIVNATTAPYLVDKLGITAAPAARQTLLKMFHQQLVTWSITDDNPPEVTAALKAMLHEAEEEIDHQQVSSTGPASSRAAGKHLKRASSKLLVTVEESAQTNASILDGRRIAKANLEDRLKEAYPGHTWAEAVNKILGEDPDDKLIEESLLDKVDEMVQIVEEEGVDSGMAKVINQCFLTMVYNNYWNLINEGDLRPGSLESEVLFTSVRVALSPFRADLIDYSYVHEKMVSSAEFKDEVQDDEDNPMSDEAFAGVKKDTMLAKTVASAYFNMTVAIVILLNSLQVMAEEIWRNNCLEKCGSKCAKKAIDDHKMWLVLDYCFTLFFLAEFCMKFGLLKLRYFMDNWNRFDFFLVIVGIFGLISDTASSGEAGEAASSSRIIRVARVLRTLRFLRIFRLFHAKLSADKYVSQDLARHMKKMVTLSCFTNAHLTAQSQLLKYFGGNGKLDEVNESEIARCILQSQTFVYRALDDAARTKEQVGADVNQELETLRKRKKITEGLSRFVSDAHTAGALSATETHAILHPLNHQIAMCMKALNDRAEGVLEKGTPAHLQVGHGSHGQGLGHSMSHLLGRMSQRTGSDDMGAQAENDQRPLVNDGDGHDQSTLVVVSPADIPVQPHIPQHLNTDKDEDRLSEGDPRRTDEDRLSEGDPRRRSPR